MSALTDIDLLPPDVNIGQTGHEKWHDYIHSGLIAVKNLLVTLDDAAVKKTGDQTIAGAKTFSSPVVGATPTQNAHLSTKLYVDQGLSGKTDTGHVHSIANITSLQSTLDSKANLASPTFTGTVGGITKSMVGLPNVDNTADTAKPVSTLQQTALNLKANLAGATFTGDVVSPVFKATGNFTSDTGSDSANLIKYTKIADIAISSRYTEGHVVLSMAGLNGGLPGSFATVDLFARQQDVFGADPIVSLKVTDQSGRPGGAANEIVKANDFVAVVSQNTPTTIVELYVNLPFLYHKFSYAPSLAAGAAAINFYTSSPFIDLPTGTKFYGVNYQLTLTKLTMEGPISAGNFKVTDLATPTANKDAAPKDYVDTALSNALATGVVKTTTDQTIAGVKSFTSAPKLKSTSTAGYAWVATGSDGSGDWSAIVNAPGGTVPWANITGRPTTFTPEAHVHAISDITSLSSTLSGKVDTTRTLSAGTGLTGGGDLSANRTFAVVYGTTASSAAQGNDSRLSDTRIPTDASVTTAKIADANITLPKLATTAKPYDICFVQSLDTRAVGYGEMVYGIRIPKAIVITSIRFRMGTADASGTTTCQLYSSATAAAANTAIAGTSGTAAIDPTAVTGALSIAAGTYLYVYTSAIGTTPGKGLVADIEAYLA